ncbi:ribonucleotide-diphosphate reductase subunit alpha, partial [Burkholderia mallei]
AGAPVALPGARGWTPARRVLLRGGPWLALALVFAGFSVSSPLFVTFANLGNVLQQSAVTGLLAFGLTIVMIGGGADAIKGGLDLSIAANLGLCAAVFAALTRGGHGDALALAATCATGVAVGALASCALLSGSAPGAGDYLLPVVAAVLLGVVFSRRLVPTIPGTLVAVLFVGLLANGFQLNSVSSYWVSGVEGALILFVVAAVALLRRRRSQGAFDA